MSAIEAIRTSVALTDAAHVTAVRVSGAGAFATIDRLCPRELFLRDKQILHTLLLREDGRALADLCIAADDDTFVLLAEGMTSDELAAHVRAYAVDTVEVVDLSPTHGVLSLDGPYAWELFGEVEGPEVIGQPYMSFFHADDFSAFRIGETGEYGYYLLTPRERIERVRAVFRDRGARFDLIDGDLEALDQCALENWFFNIRREGQLDLSPVELQLQWRVSYKKTFVGSTGLAERRRTASRRIVQCAAQARLPPAAGVMYRDQRIGVIVNAGFSPVRGDWIGMALLDRAYSHPGIDAFTAIHDGAEVPITTLAAPALNNRSLYVNPQIHSYQTRAEVTYPPLVAPVR